MNRSFGLRTLIILVCTSILSSSASAFKKDPKVLGEWVSVDFVSNISNFKPGKKYCPDDLYLKEFEFHQGGGTQDDAFTWTKGKVYYSEFGLDGKYVIKKKGGTDFLFLQWINGDVAHDGKNPSYYVFVKKGASYRISDSFINDPDVIGKWKSVDFVSNISDFSSDPKSWDTHLYLKEFEFNKGGSTQNNAFTWTKGKVHYTEFGLDGKYEIRKIGDKEYLFLQWMNGDVAQRGDKPSYYAFKRK